MPSIKMSASEAKALGLSTLRKNGWVSLQLAAYILGVHKSTLKEYVNKGKILSMAFKSPKNTTHRFYADEIEYIQSNGWRTGGNNDTA